MQKKSDALALARWEQAQAGCGWWMAKLAFSQPMFSFAANLNKSTRRKTRNPEFLSAPFKMVHSPFTLGFEESLFLDSRDEGR